MLNAVMVAVTEPSPPPAQRVQGLPKLTERPVNFTVGNIGTGLEQIQVNCELYLVRAAIMPDRTILAAHSERNGAFKAEHLHVTQEKWEQGTK
jgi:hypothetical protein